MSWDGKGFDKPLIMLDNKTPQEAMEKNAYKPSDDVRKLIKDKMSSEELIGALRSKDMFKEACDLMAHCINRRVGVWWAYSCVDTVNKEVEAQLKISPFTPKELREKEVKAKLADLNDRSELDALQKQAAAEGNEYEKIAQKVTGEKLLKPDDPWAKAQAEFRSQQTKKFGPAEQAVKEMDAALGNLSSQERASMRKGLDKIYAKYEAEHGVHPMAELEKQLTLSISPEPADMPDTPTTADKYYAVVERKIKETEEFISRAMNKHFPLNIPKVKVPTLKDKVDDALFSVKRWILTPTDENGQLARDAAVPVISEPEGLCAVTAFWSSTDLLPEEKSILHPPPGLASSGVQNTIFLCAMKEGGSKDYDERYQEYFDIGIDCVSGVRTWDKVWHKKPERKYATPPKKESDFNECLNVKFGFGREF
ncbi:MAG: hypothetical protein GY750_06370 [Lentisphaerae bacterium]|nr:hypothetical protein [Lentisphaerota bacterium]MCP4101033.1 hypothetical protein [Lentisphaerota bacterium]